MHRNPDSLSKSNSVLVRAVKDASCNKGWVRSVIQGIFGFITFASFTLILIMAIQRKPVARGLISGESRCVFARCRVICTGAPSYGSYESDIINTVKVLNSICGSVHLSLYNAQFINRTIPKNWLSHANTEIKSLLLVAGNLNYIESGAFVTSFFNKIDHLELEDISLSDWHPDMLLGLQNLKTLVVRDCRFKTIQKNSLRAVDETLESLEIINSGFWEIENVTGSSYLISLKEINFSSNSFGILTSNSFTRIDRCNVLDLSSSAITAIEPHTFDYILEIEKINLSYNHIVMLPENLFSRVMLMGTATPKIDLHRNRWHCDCDLQYIVDLNNQGVLNTEPLCYSPIAMFKKPISVLQRNCSAIDSLHAAPPNTNDKTTTDFYVDLEFFVLNHNNSCLSNSNGTKVISPVRKYSCHDETTSLLNSYKLNSLSREAQSVSFNIQPTFFVESTNLTMLEFTTQPDISSGLIWFQTNCPEVVYCLDVLPKHLKIYNIAIDVRYTLCPIQRSGTVDSSSCITYRAKHSEETDDIAWLLPNIRFLIYAIAIICGVLFGASLIYGIIRRNPTLLKGSKRVLLVKHKIADAIILPSKVSLKINDVDYTNFGNKYKDTFDEPARNMGTLTSGRFNKSFSIRSSKSNAPSYISALQPTEDQLKEWRLKHHFDNYSTLTSISSTEYISCIYRGDIVFQPLDAERGSSSSGTSRIVNLE